MSYTQCHFKFKGSTCVIISLIYFINLLIPQIFIELVTQATIVGGGETVMNKINYLLQGSLLSTWERQNKMKQVCHTVMSAMESSKATQGQRYVILYRDGREGLYNKMKSEQRPEVENSRPSK